MKNFFKENFLNILVLILIGLIFILWGRVLVSKISRDANTSNLHTTEDRVRCVKSFGWEVDASSETQETVYIPEEFDDVYERYNVIQKLSGFDLTKYQGKGVLKYTYRVLNFPDNSQEEAFVNIYIYNGKMIGGDCLTVALDGFMLPIDRRFDG